MAKCGVVGGKLFVTYMYFVFVYVYNYDDWSSYLGVVFWFRLFVIVVPNFGCVGYVVGACIMLWLH